VTVNRLPHALHEWAPVEKAGPGETRSVPLSRSAGAGRGDRTGQGLPWPLGLTRAAGGGAKSIAAAGAGRALPCTLGTATGVRPAKQAVGAGSPWLLAFSRASGFAVKSTSGFAVLRVLPLDRKPASGQAGKQGSGLPFLLSRPQAVGQGSKQGGGQGSGRACKLSLRPSSRNVRAIHREFALVGPVESAVDRLLPVRSVAFVATTNYAHTVWRQDGEWHSALIPGANQLRAADVVFDGGRTHFLSDDLRAELTAAGYADAIQLEEIR
jgi:hypothetical protein